MRCDTDVFEVFITSSAAHYLFTGQGFAWKVAIPGIPGKKVTFQNHQTNYYMNEHKTKATVFACEVYGTVHNICLSATEVGN